MRILAFPRNQLPRKKFIQYCLQNKHFEKKYAYYIYHYEHDMIEHSYALFQAVLFVAFVREVDQYQPTMLPEYYAFQLPSGRWSIGLPFHLTLHRTDEPGLAYCIIDLEFQWGRPWPSCFCHYVVIPNEYLSNLNFLYRNPRFAPDSNRLYISFEIEPFELLWGNHMVCTTTFPTYEYHPFSDGGQYLYLWEFLNLANKDELSELYARRIQPWFRSVR